MHVTVFPGSAPQEVVLGSAGATVVNGGPGTVYYATTQGVSATVNDGSLASGASTTLLGTQFLFVARSDSRADVEVTALTSVSGSGAELAYAEITANPTAIGTTLATVAGLQIVIPAGTGVYMVEAWGLWNVSGGGLLQMQIVDEGGLSITTGFLDAANSTSGGPGAHFFLKKRMPATATAKTLTVQAKRTNGTTGTIFAAPGNTSTAFAGGPAYIQAYGR